MTGVPGEEVALTSANENDRATEDAGDECEGEQSDGRSARILTHGIAGVRERGRPQRTDRREVKSESNAA